MKKSGKWLILLLFIPLLCGAGEAETPTKDPRALWREADAALEGYNFIDMDSTDEVTMTIHGTEGTAVMSSRIRGSDLKGNAPAYQMVTTGDQIGEIYYANGTAYANMPYGRYRSPMAPEDFWAFISDGLLVFTEADFAAVELQSAENGYAIAFSQPSEELVETIAAQMAEGFDGIRDADVSGTMYLDADGALRETVLEMSMTLLQPSGQEIPMSVYSTQRLLAHDESVVVRLPDKLFDFAECEDVRAYAMLYDVLNSFQNAGRTEYQSLIKGTGRYSNSSQNYGELMQTRLERDVLGEDYHYYWEHISLWQGEHVLHSYALDLSSEGKWVKGRVNGGGEQSTEVDITDEEAVAVMLSDMNDFTSTAMMDQYEDVVMQQTDGIIEISFQPSRELRVFLSDYMLDQLVSSGARRLLKSEELWEFSDCSGLVLLDEEGQLESMVIVVNFFVNPQNNGTVTYTRSVKSLNEPVNFPQEYVAAIDRATNGEEVIW